MTIPAVLVVASLLLDIAAAIPWPGPMPTPAGLMAMAGMSPRPTDAPGSQGIPQELRKRNVQYPPPENWCGFVTGDYSENGLIFCLSRFLIIVQMMFSAVGHSTPVPFLVPQLVVAQPLPEPVMHFTRPVTITLIIATRHASWMFPLYNGMSDAHSNHLLCPLVRRSMLFSS